jgi:hypothetical protein
MRTQGIPAASGEPLSLYRNDQLLKRHAAYKAAKGGDPIAAATLIGDLAAPLLEQVKRFEVGARPLGGTCDRRRNRSARGKRITKSSREFRIETPVALRSRRSKARLS